MRTITPTGVPSAAGRLHRAGRLVRRGLVIAAGYFPLTPRGLLLVAGLGLLAWVNRGEQVDLIVRSVCLGGLALLALVFLLVAGSALALLLRRQRPGEDVLILEVGTPTGTGYQLGAAARNPLVRVEVAWEEPTGVEVELAAGRGGLQEEATAHERGYREVIRRCLTVTDVFGLTRLRVRRRQRHVVRCFPRCGSTPRIPLPQQFRPGDEMGHPEGHPEGDLVEMRRYVMGDPLKLVLWRAYARTGKMLVRSAERAVSPTTRLLVYLVAAPGDEPAAGISRGALESGVLGPEAIFRAEGAVERARSTAEAVEQILRSADYRDAGGLGLDGFLGWGEKVGTSACLLFVPPRPGPWLQRVAEALSAHQGPFRAVIGVDGPLQEKNEHPWLGRLLHGRRAGQTSLTDVRRVRDRLQQAGCMVAIVERQTGQVVSLPSEEGEAT